MIEQGCQVHAPGNDAECRSCKALLGFGGVNASDRRLCSAALKWADASARDPEEVETETRELRETLLDRAWAYRQACREYADTLSGGCEARGEPDGQ